MKCNYNYRFHTSILLTNRQIYTEASDIFYMENLFIRVNSYLPIENFDDDYYNDAGALMRCYRLPLLCEGSKAQACTRHAMEIDFIKGRRSDRHDRDHHFILACDDLPNFCRTLLLVGEWNALSDNLLFEIELWIIIGDEVGYSGDEDKSTDGHKDKSTDGHKDKSTDGHKALLLTAATKNAAAIREGAIKNPNERDASVYTDGMAHGSIEARSRLLKPPIQLDSPRARRLLEPFRALHSVRYSYIDAPISEVYLLEMLYSLSRERPSIQDCFSVVDSAYEDAIACKDFALAILKMRATLDILNDFWAHLGNRDITFVLAGRYSGVHSDDAIDRIEESLWNYLARVHLKFDKDLRHVRAAQACTRRYIENYIRDEVWVSYMHPHERAMAYYLEAEVWEALDQLGEHHGRPRSTDLKDVVDMLTKALRHEPENVMVEKELQRRLAEKELAEMIGEVTEMEWQDSAETTKEVSEMESQDSAETTEEVSEMESLDTAETIEEVSEMDWQETGGTEISGNGQGGEGDGGR